MIPRLQRKTTLSGIFVLWCVMAAAAADAQLTFNLTTTGDPLADAGFQRAADYLSGQFDDAITVNITAGFSSLGPTILGQAGSQDDVYSFTDWKAAVGGDVLSVDDVSYVAALPAGNSFSVFLNRTDDSPHGSGSAVPYVDNDGGANNTSVRLNRANAKAIGLVAANDIAEDAAITFSSDFTFDFDPSDGIDAGAIDFVGVAIHEIMHAMGFTSGVDILDGNSPDSGGTFLRRMRLTGYRHSTSRDTLLTVCSRGPILTGLPTHAASSTRLTAERRR